MEIEKSILDKVNVWLEGNYDEQTKSSIRQMLESDPQEIIESFYKNLAFGTGGLRGIMGVGSNRMNIYTVGAATQGLANYLKKEFASLDQIKVAVSYDSRNNSELFAKCVANVFAANSFKVFLFDALRPTPELSFAVRELGCQSGVMVTASHNPKQYNGYKAYWSDGGQVVAPHDTNIIDEVNKVTSVDDIKWNGGEENITIIGAEFDQIYLSKIKALSLSPELIEKHSDLKVVYTPIHGTGRVLVPSALASYGFKNVTLVEEQMEADGNFPTVVNPNPEEASALKLAIAKAEEVGASLVIATDPDADRIGIAVRNDKGEMVLLNGNQTASIVTYYILNRMKELGKLNGNQFIVKTIVTTDLLAKIADSFSVNHFNVLTGFKFIADIIKSEEGKSEYICGGEESYGFLIGDFVRDKDAVSCSAMVCEVAAWAAEQGKTLYDILLDIYVQYGFYREGLVSITKEGKSGAEQIQEMMCTFRANPPKSLGGSEVVAISDYQEQYQKDLKSGVVTEITYPKSDVLQFITEEGAIISMRPSGTEPKIKFYFSVREPMCCAGKYGDAEAAALAKIETIKAELGL